MSSTPKRSRSGVSQSKSSAASSAPASSSSTAVSSSKKVAEYKSPEPSILSRYVFFPFYDRLVTYFPQSWVPNYITIFGIGCTLFASFLMFACIPPGTVFLNSDSKTGENLGWALFRSGATNPDLSTAANQVAMRFPLEFLPSAAQDFLLSYAAVPAITVGALFFAGFLNGVYCAADNTDGRQARRTKQTSLIGEYLDHGLDCVTALLSCFLMTLCLGQTANAAMSTTAIIALVTCLSHVLHHSDHIFIWGNSYVTVDEAMVGFAVAPMLYGLMPAGGLGQFAFPAIEAFEGIPVLEELKNYAVLDIILALFLLVQTGIIRDLLTFRWSNAFNGAWVSLWVVTGIFFFLAGTHDNKADHLATAWPITEFLKTEVPYGLTSYVALWATTYCFVASILTHIPILAQCARIQNQDFWPLALVFIVIILFVSSPVYGCIFSIVAHFAQVQYNIKVIHWEAAKRAAKEQ